MMIECGCIYYRFIVHFYWCCGCDDRFKTMRVFDVFQVCFYKSHLYFALLIFDIHSHSRHNVIRAALWENFSHASRVCIQLYTSPSCWR